MKIGYKRNGRIVTQKEFLAGPKVGGEGVPAIAGSGWPMKSIGLSVHRTQATEFNERYAREGIVGARHLPDGTCVLDSRAARRKVLKSRGVRDNDAGYGDFAGNH